MTLSKHSALSRMTDKLKSTSRGLRNANQSDSSTSETIGVKSFHMLLFTLEKIALPSSSQPESQTSSCGNAASSVDNFKAELRDPFSIGLINPSANRLVAVREVTLSKIH